MEYFGADSGEHLRSETEQDVPAVSSFWGLASAAVSSLNNAAQEFASSLQDEHADLIQEVAQSDVKEQLVKAGSSLKTSLQAVDSHLENVDDQIAELGSKFLSLFGTPRGNDDQDESGGPAVSHASRFRALRRAMDQDSSSYLTDPAPFEAFQTFSADLTEAERQAISAQILRDNKTVAAFFTDLVPNKVSETMFWCRYLFRLAGLRRAEADQKAESPASSSPGPTKKDANEDALPGWGDEMLDDDELDDADDGNSERSAGGHLPDPDTKEQLCEFDTNDVVSPESSSWEQVDLNASQNSANEETAAKRGHDEQSDGEWDDWS